MLYALYVRVLDESAMVLDLSTHHDLHLGIR